MRTNWIFVLVIVVFSVILMCQLLIVTDDFSRFFIEIVHIDVVI